MKMFSLALVVLTLSLSANAGEFNFLTAEDVVMTVLTSPELAAEKETDQLMGKTLEAIHVETQSETMVVFLTYANNVAPCTVRAEVISKNTVPDGAAGVHMVLKIVSLNSVCAVP